MEKIDFKKDDENFVCTAAKDFSTVDVPPLQYLMIDGMGRPEPDQQTGYAQALRALYPLPGNGLVENGHHHEISLGDPRKTAPEKLKTVLRQPVRHP